MMTRGSGIGPVRAAVLGQALALAAIAAIAGSTAAPAQQMPQQCATFPKLTEEAQKRGNAVSEAMKAKVDPKQICALMNNFITAESAVVKFLTDNQTWCGVPANVVTSSKTNHEKSLKFRTMVCSNADAPRQKAPSLSDAIKTTPVDSSKNTKTGTGGTFDTLTGNPLAR
jgi:hypothetical protein